MSRGKDHWRTISRSAGLFGLIFPENRHDAKRFFPDTAEQWNLRDGFCDVPMLGSPRKTRRKWRPFSNRAIAHCVQARVSISEMVRATENRSKFVPGT